MLLRDPAPVFGNAFPAAPPTKPRPKIGPLTRWRAGPEGTAGNERYRVRVDGEPAPTAYAADVLEGSVWEYVPVKGIGGQTVEPRKRFGRVEIVPDPFG